MLDISTAKVVKKALDEYFSYNAISLENVCRMVAIPANSTDSLTILVLQYRELTIMVHIEVKNSGVVVRSVKTEAW